MRKHWIAILLALLLLPGCGGREEAPSAGELPPPAATQQGDDPSKPSSTKPSGSKLPEPPEEHVEDRQDIVADPELAALQEEIAGGGGLIGVAYLGSAELPGFEDVCVYVEASGYADTFPFLLHVTEAYTVLTGGYELYAVVPADREVVLTISTTVLDEANDYEIARGEDLLTVSDGSPLLLTCVSETMPSLMITAEKNGASLEYCPGISGMDGLLLVDEGVCDLTNYALLWGTYPSYDQLPDPIFTLNTWHAQHHDGDGNLLAMTLILNPDGSVEYSYGWPYSGVFEAFTGTWSEGGPGDPHLLLELAGGPVDDLGEPIQGEQYETSCTFSWDIHGSALVLSHEDGSPLLYGTQGDRYTWMSFDGFHMVNNWTSLSKHRDWYYDLQLFETEECVFSIGEMGGSVMAGYEGWWYLTEENILVLNLILGSGVHPENPELEYISGEYLVESWEPTGMTLAFVSGDILTTDMEETAKASFFGY